jgi:hypothetical protein
MFMPSSFEVIIFDTRDKIKLHYNDYIEDKELYIKDNILYLLGFDTFEDIEFNNNEIINIIESTYEVIIDDLNKLLL